MIVVGGGATEWESRLMPPRGYDVLLLEQGDFERALQPQ
jgi:glycerol-3-phosphate dehydrogenase